MMTKYSQIKLKNFDFNSETDGGLLIAAGGFENRALTYISKLKRPRTKFENSIILKYISQSKDNEENFSRLFNKMCSITDNEPLEIEVDVNSPIKSCEDIKKAITGISSNLNKQSCFIDISAMTHLWITMAVHSATISDLVIKILYTESKYYYPYKKDKNKILTAWNNQNYKEAAKFLQSEGLQEIIIHPDFQGNFRPGKQTVLMIFVGYEPNRIGGLIEYYSPGKLIIYYGISPHHRFEWRSDFSKKLHENLFSSYYVHESNASTLKIHEILDLLEKDYLTIREQYDLAICSQNSKIQTLSSYLFWRMHPETQLIFTSPAYFVPERYSRLSMNTYLIEI